MMADLIETQTYDERDEKMIVRTTYDNTAVLEQNKRERNAAAEFGRYKGNLVKVGSIHMGDIVRLKNMGYDVLAADPAETRRALLYIQSNEPHLMTVPGTPIARAKTTWN
jgi:hypothetical protein